MTANNSSGMQKLFDRDTILGVIGTGTTAAAFITNFSAGVTILAGLATAAYMALKAGREWIKFKAELDKRSQHQTKNKYEKIPTHRFPVCHNCNLPHDPARLCERDKID